MVYWSEKIPLVLSQAANPLCSSTMKYTKEILKNTKEKFGIRIFQFLAPQANSTSVPFYKQVQKKLASFGLFPFCKHGTAGKQHQRSLLQTSEKTLASFGLFRFASVERQANSTSVPFC